MKGAFCDAEDIVQILATFLSLVGAALFAWGVLYMAFVK